MVSGRSCPAAGAAAAAAGAAGAAGAGAAGAGAAGAAPAAAGLTTNFGACLAANSASECQFRCLLYPCLDLKESLPHILQTQLVSVSLEGMRKGMVLGDGEYTRCQNCLSGIWEKFVGSLGYKVRLAEKFS